MTRDGSLNGSRNRTPDAKWRLYLEKKVYSAPTIQGKIADQGRIDGNFSQESAHELAQILRAGALPASIKYLEERTVGPSLGADSIRHGVQASVLSLVVVMIFMVFYYRLSGANAVLALILNLIILLAAMAMFGAVLTLPGIAGVILTIGMGVDSNVLVFERIREEIRNGKSASAAVEAGFDKAFLNDYRYARDYRGVGDFPVHFWNWPDSRICHHVDHRFDRQRVHGHLCVQDDFPVSLGEDGSAGRIEHLARI